MCFSPVASFGASGGLAVIGVKTLQKTESKKEIPFAMIPFLFAVQQFFEGLVWILPDSTLMASISTYYFIVFAFVLWPALLPFSIYLMEPGPKRKQILKVISVIGVFVALSLLYFIVKNPVSAEIVNKSVFYDIGGVHDRLYVYLYLVAVCLSCFISSHRMIVVLGVALVLSFLASIFFYLNTYISVWCFFAALLSVIIYLHFRWRGRFKQLGT